jgi:hypothetical protein
MLGDVARERGPRLVLYVRLPSNGGNPHRHPKPLGNAGATSPPGSATAGSISWRFPSSCWSEATCRSTNGSRRSQRFRSREASNAPAYVATL